LLKHHKELASTVERKQEMPPFILKYKINSDSKHQISKQGITTVAQKRLKFPQN